MTGIDGISLRALLRTASWAKEFAALGQPICISGLLKKILYTATKASAQAVAL